MVIIRLSRSGAKKRPFYNIVVTDSRNRRDGRFNERLGFYNPMIAEGAQRLTFNAERVDFWAAAGLLHDIDCSRLPRRLPNSFLSDEGRRRPMSAVDVADSQCLLRVLG